MSRLLGLELHSHGFSLATVGAGPSIDTLALPDDDGVFAHTGALGWKWSLGAAGDLIAIATAGSSLRGPREPRMVRARTAASPPARNATQSR